MLSKEDLNTMRTIPERAHHYAVIAKKHGCSEAVSLALAADKVGGEAIHAVERLLDALDEMLDEARFEALTARALALGHVQDVQKSFTMANMCHSDGGLTCFTPHRITPAICRRSEKECRLMFARELAEKEMENYGA